MVVMMGRHWILLCVVVTRLPERILGETLSLATVDLSGESDEEIGTSLLAAFASSGAASIVGHGVDVDATLSAAEALFRSTDSGTKRALSAGRSQRGFIARGAESGGGGVEAKEGFAYGAAAPAFASSLSEANKWPSDCRARAVLEAAHANLTIAASALVGAAVRGGAASLRGCCDGDSSDIALSRLFRYESRRTAPLGATGSSPHSDWGLLTLIVADDVADDAGGALEFDVDGEWVAGHAGSAGALVANAGDFFALNADVDVASPRHRVVLSDADRVSLVYFMYPDYATRIPDANSPKALALSLLQCQNRERGTCAARPPDTTFGDLISEKWRQVTREPN